MSEIRTQKSEIRGKYLAVRDAIPSEQKEAFDKKIFNRLIGSITYRHCTDVLLYASARGEADTWMIFEKALADGKKVAFPCCNPDNTMTFRYVTSKDQLSQATFGLLEPHASCEECTPSNFSLLIVPGLVFDKSGYRVGLIEVDSTHPFYSLEGSDNAMLITTEYYPNGVVIKGAGAGARQTASGLLNDILN
jgi:5,10-methenyltetrahydrofolate synthetase